MGLDPPSSAQQVPKGPFLELLHPASVNPVQGVPSAQILGLQENPMWRESPAGPLINVLWVGLSTIYLHSILDSVLDVITLSFLFLINTFLPKEHNDVLL